MKLNSEQQKFVDASNKNVLVSANAGSGKTSTMITKIMDIIAKNGSLKNIMAVTFTRAAANDICQKLFSRLLELISTSSGAEKERLSEELDNISTASIGTVHSMCGRIIEKYYYVINLNPNFSIATDGILNNLKDLAMQNVINQINVSKDEKFYPLFERFNGKRDLAGLYKNVYSLSEFLNALENPDKWLKECKKSHEFYFDFILKSWKEEVANMLSEVRVRLQQAEDLDVNILKKYYGGAFQNLERLLGAETVEQFINIISPMVITPVPPVRKGLEGIEYLVQEARDFHKDLKDKTDKLRGSVKDYNVTLLEEYGDENNKMVDLLVELVLRFQEEFGKIKRERKLVDFSDMETFAYQILQNETVASEVKAQYEYIFVDEYQDVNYKQDAIIAKMSRGDNVFMIGDVKQSIYAFRQSTPEIFLDKYHKYFGGEQKNKLICFNQNYRSQPEILSFANSVCDELITENTVGINYRDQAHLETDKKVIADGLPKVKMTLVDKLSNKKQGDEKPVNYWEEEGKIVVNEIANLLEKGYYFDANDNKQPINYGDIAILVRDLGENAEVLHQQLVSAGIPVSVRLKKELFDNSQIIQIVSLMRVMDNGFDDYSLATVLLSPFCGCTEQELANISIKNDENLPFYELAMRSDNKKIVALREKLNRYRMNLLKNTVGELLENVLEEHDLFNLWLSLPDGMGIVSNVKELMNLVNNCSDQYSLSAVLNYIDAQIEAKNDSKTNLGESENSVKIMTMHSSKGLEFPVVFLCSMGKDFVCDPKTVEINRELGIGLKIADLVNRTEHETPQHIACAIAKKRLEMNEQLRLLYVALTRPRNILRIVGSYALKNANKISVKADGSVYGCKNFLELLFKSMSKDEIATISAHIPTRLKNGCLVEVVSNIEEPAKEENSKIILSTGNAELEEKLKKCYSFEYPRTVAIATKNTVSSILKEEVDYANAYAVTSFELKNLAEDEDRADVGTKYHAVMERLTYKEGLEDIRKLVLDVFGQDDKTVVNEIFEAVNVLKSIVSDNKIYKEAQFIMQDNYNKFVAHSDANDKVLVQGVVDLVIMTDDGAIVVDFKTNRGKNEKFFKEIYGLQLDLYAKAVAEGMRVDKVSKYIYSFDLGKLLKM